MAMTGRQRMLAAMRGEAVDRPPTWLREGFELLEDPADTDHFTRGWQAEPLYRELVDYVKPHVDVITGWGCGAFNRLLMVPPKYLHSEVVEQTPERIRRRTTIQTPRGKLTELTEQRRGMQTTWHIEPAVKSLSDLAALAEVPFEIDPRLIPPARQNHAAALQRMGDRGVVRIFLSSPIVCISGTMTLELFLELSYTERRLMHELAAEITRRQLAVLERVWADGPLDTTATLGGNEQCTPPMMAPGTFDEYVVPYDGQLVRFMKDRGVPVQVHCHGKVRHALRGMLEMGVDATDPVEPPPQGDVSWAEARAIAGDRLTLMGNLEFSELEHAEPDTIRRRVREMLSDGPRRVILGASAGPISAVTPRLAENYRAWIDTALETSP